MSLHKFDLMCVQCWVWWSIQLPPHVIEAILHIALRPRYMLQMSKFDARFKLKDAKEHQKQPKRGNAKSNNKRGCQNPTNEDIDTNFQQLFVNHEYFIVNRFL